MSLLNAKGICKSFGDKQVLKNVDISINKGDVTAILGPSGSGKTTLLRCLNFLERADSGILTFDDAEYDLSKIKRKDIAAIRKKTAFVFQNYELFSNMSALDNVALGLTVGRGMSREEAEKIASEMLAKVGLSKQAAQYPIQLSGGQQQRVSIARAIAVNPEIIYFDEPTSALDPELTGEILKVIRDLAAQHWTMVIVTHEISFARNVSDRVVFMAGGVIVEEGRPEDVIDHPSNERTRAFLSNLSK